MALSLWKHQQEIFDRIKDASHWALFCEVGTGKTAVVIKLIESHWAKRPVLIVCPKSVRQSWVDQVTLFSDLLSDRAQIIEGSPAKRKEKLRDRYKLIHIMNYETAVSSFASLPYYYFIVCDESHYLKSHTAKRTKAMIKLAGIADFVFLMTGTPMPNGILDIFSQFLILDRGRTFGKNWFAFRNHYMQDLNAAWRDKLHHYPKYEPKEGAFEKVLYLISKKSTSLKKDDCLSLPDQVYQSLICEMGDEQRRAYNQMSVNYIAWLESGESVTAGIALVKLLRLLQISNGFVQNESGAVYRFKKNPKMELLKEQLKDLTPYHKVIVWANFIANLEEIYAFCSESNLQPARLYGEYNIATDIDRFQSDPRCRVMVANPASGGAGITLSASSVALYYSNSFNLAHRLQSEGRNHRIGSERHSKITYIDILNKDTIDFLVLGAIKSKKKLSDMVLSLSKENLYGKQL